MTIERSKEEQAEATKMFDAFRDELLKRELSNTENYDKSILTLSSAALGVSISAIRFVIPMDKAECIWLVKFGWVLLLCSIITSLSAFLVSNKAISVQLKNSEDYYINGISDAFNRLNICSLINVILNYITGVIFVVAISTIITFVVINIDLETQKMTKDNKVTTILRKTVKKKC